MKPPLGDMYLSLRRELEELIQQKLLDPKLDMQSHDDLLMATRLLVSEDQCEGRFVFGRKLPAQSEKATKESNKSSKHVVAGDNSKNELQTLLTRAGHGAPHYKTTQLKNNQFRSTVIFNGLNFVGKPCGSKKLAEKDAAAEALLWLKGETYSHSRVVDNVSALLKKSKKKKQDNSSSQW